MLGITKFETIGVEFQNSAPCREVADKRFKISCDLCCRKGLHIECERCAIASAHALVLAAFEALHGNGEGSNEGTDSGNGNDTEPGI